MGLASERARRFEDCLTQTREAAKGGVRVEFDEPGCLSGGETRGDARQFRGRDRHLDPLRAPSGRADPGAAAASGGVTGPLQDMEIAFRPLTEEEGAGSGAGASTPKRGHLTVKSSVEPK